MDENKRNIARNAYKHNGEFPSVCVRCKSINSAEGYYETGTPNHCRIGICRVHKRHGGAKIVWYANL